MNINIDRCEALPQPSVAALTKIVETRSVIEGSTDPATTLLNLRWMMTIIMIND